MATPRRAAAKAAAALVSRKASIGSGTPSPTKREDDEGLLPGGRKEKAKVDWRDVEAKAKREAMWLLEWRKQQAAQKATLPTHEMPPKKRRRKSCSRDDTPTAVQTSNTVASTTTTTTTTTTAVEPRKD
ncbi:unnamed protein product, partial [Ectocarpus sp. 12 AP-2014]